MNCVAEISTEFSVLTNKCISGCELRSPALVEMKGAGEAKDRHIAVVNVNAVLPVTSSSMTSLVVGQWWTWEYPWRTAQTSMSQPTVPWLLIGTGMKSSVRFSDFTLVQWALGSSWCRTILLCCILMLKLYILNKKNNLLHHTWIWGFSADSLKLCQVGWGPSVDSHFQVSPYLCNSKCFIISNRTCFSFLKVFHLSFKRLLQV